MALHSDSLPCRDWHPLDVLPSLQPMLVGQAASLLSRAHLVVLAPVHVGPAGQPGRVQDVRGLDLRAERRDQWAQHAGKHGNRPPTKLGVGRYPLKVCQHGGAVLQAPRRVLVRVPHGLQQLPDQAPDPAAPAEDQEPLHAPSARHAPSAPAPGAPATPPRGSLPDTPPTSTQLSAPAAPRGTGGGALGPGGARTGSQPAWRAMAPSAQPLGAAMAAEAARGGAWGAGAVAGAAMAAPQPAPTSPAPRLNPPPPRGQLEF